MILNMFTGAVNKTISIVFMLFVAGLLVACHDEDDIDFEAPQISIDSPPLGSDVNSLSVTVSGTVSSDTVFVQLTVENSTTTVVAATLTGTTFTANISVEAGNNSVSAMAQDANGNRNTITFNLHYPQLSLTDGQAAAFVIGQADTGTNNPNQGSVAAANTLSTVQGTLFERGISAFYVPDTGNNRVLGFNAVPAVSNTAANFVIGQTDFATVTGGTTATQLMSPTGIFTTADKLFVADSGNHRVLIWNSLITSGSVDADNVIGQPDLTSGGPNCTGDTLSNPASVFVANDKVFVLDKGNHRVLIWNTIPTTDGAPADVVIGQIGMSAMTTCLPNDSDGNGVTDTLTASTLSNPGGMWTDGIRLLVADTGNNRVLVWDDISMATNGAAADWVIGQTDMISAVAALDQDSLDAPLSVTSNGNQIVVADSGNARVLIFNGFPVADGPMASNVIGQADFTSNTTGTSATAMTSYDNVFVDRSRLFVVDGNRILVFTNPP